MLFKVRIVVGEGGLEIAHPALFQSGQYVVGDLHDSYTRVFAL